MRGEEKPRERGLILDFGYVEEVESWGSDERIVEAARMSTGKGFLGWGDATCGACGQPWEKTGAIPFPNQPRCPVGRGGGHDGPVGERGDEKLLRYLYEHRHSTPFEMAGLIVEVQAPILVFREWHRHRTQSYNEMSARYMPLPDVNYVPTVERLMQSGGRNKQATGTGADLTHENAERFRSTLASAYAAIEATYQTALKNGVPKELARCILPVGRYSRMRAGANLRNWLGFLALRLDPAAQWEIRQYAIAVEEIIARRFPRTWSLFSEKRQ